MNPIPATDGPRRGTANHAPTWPVGPRPPADGALSGDARSPNLGRTTAERLGDQPTTAESLLAEPGIRETLIGGTGEDVWGRSEAATAPTQTVIESSSSPRPETLPDLPVFGEGFFTRLRARQDLARHENLAPRVTAGSASVSTAFGTTPGESTYLIDVGRERQLLATSYGTFVVEDGRITEMLRPGESVRLAEAEVPLSQTAALLPAITASLDATSGEITLEGTVQFPLHRQTLTISPEEGTLTTRAREFFGFGTVRRTFDLNAGDLPPGVTAAEAFSHYGATPEGRALLAAEGDVYGSAADHQRLFVARVRFARGEGGRELFDEFTPRRAALSGEELSRYDALVDRVVTHIDASSYNTTDNRTLDSGLQYIIASGLVESLGVDEVRVGQVLDNLSGGWIVSHDGSAGISRPGVNGTYWPTGSVSGTGASSGLDGPSIGFRLSSLVDSYADPDDGFELIGHEAAHALDGDARGGTDGLPIGLGAADVATLRAERTRLDRAFADTGDPLGLDRNAYTNEQEFWAEFSERFLSGPNGREIVRAASPAMFELLTRYYAQSAE